MSGRTVRIGIVHHDDVPLCAESVGPWSAFMCSTTHSEWELENLGDDWEPPKGWRITAGSIVVPASWDIHDVMGLSTVDMLGMFVPFVV